MNINKKLLVCFFVLMFVFLISYDINAHPGNTASDGCHYCRTNCDSWGVAWNERHCHGVKSLPQPEPPIKSTYSEDGTGYKEPAPEYEKSTTKSNNNSANLLTQTNNKNETDYNWIYWLIGIISLGGIIWAWNRKK